MGGFGAYLLAAQARLVARGLTTNEAACWRRGAYAYLRDEGGRFRSPPAARGGAARACARFWARGAQLLCASGRGEAAAGGGARRERDWLKSA